MRAGLFLQSRQGILMICFFFSKFMKIIEALVDVAYNSVCLASISYYRHQLIMIWAGYFIGIVIASYISCLHAGKMLIQLLIKIFPVSLPQGHAYSEAYNSIYLCLDAIVQKPSDIFFSIIYKGKNRTKPNDCRNSIVTHNL